MSEQQWWRRATIYQVYPRSFHDASGDGVGDLRGVTRRLEYLAGVLGVDAIWLSPFYRSPMVDLGYDVTDHTAVDPLFGTLGDFDDLLAAAHELGLRVLVDYVPNHTSSAHRWFQESRSSRENPRRDWYVWADARPDGSPPNNWLSVFGGSAWTWDERTEQFFLHSFDAAMPDLNWRNPAVRAAMFAVARFWLDRGVDGFRVDVAPRVMKDPALRDNPPAPRGTIAYHRPHGDFDSQLHLHDVGHPDAHAVWREFRRLLDGYVPERVALAETHVFEPSEWASWFGPQLDEFHLPFNFGLLKAPLRAGEIGAVIDALEAATPAGGWPNWVLGNHDEPRLAGRVGEAGARIATMLLLTLRGTPTLYYGDELGLRDSELAPEQVRDPWELRSPGLGLAREPQRAPMPWTRGPNAGFCPVDVEPWLPLSADAARLSVEAQLADDGSLLSLTRRLLRARRRSDALAAGDYRRAEAPDDVLAYFRTTDTEAWMVALNFAREPRSVELPGDWSVELSTDGGDARERGRDVVALRPLEGRLLRLDPRAARARAGAARPEALEA